MGYDPMTHMPRTDLFSTLPTLIALANLLQNKLFDDQTMRLQAEASQLAKLQYFQGLVQAPIPTNSNSHNLGDLGAFHPLLNPIDQIKNQESVNNISTNENDNISQLLHNLISTTTTTHPQVPFTFQTQLNNNNNNNNIYNEGNKNNSDSQVWQTSMMLPPLMETSMSNVPGGDSCCTSSNNGVEGIESSAYWKDLLFEDVFLDEI
ncbi:hypothetical protein Leryth_016944 [Lithospermum erythrorhizon]|nr:hypothetical protein Leryth_016944 [Lithospermum erythrorhizon]